MAPVAAPIIITLIVSYLSIVIGELVPKRIGLSDAEGMAKSVAGTIMVFRRIAKPLVWLTQASANGISAILGIKSADDRQNVSEEEIKYMVSEQDTLLDEEKRMIHEIFDLGDAVAREVMVAARGCDDWPKIPTRWSRCSTRCAAPATRACRSITRTPTTSWASRTSRDLIELALSSRGKEHVRTHLRDASFVPDTKDILPLLSEMQTAHEQMVVVVDEYGGTAGLITVEDIVEEIVGEIEDEFDPDNKYLTRLSRREWLVDGRFSCDDAVELGWPIEESDDYETIAGWILDICDGVPNIGEVFEVDGYKFKVQSMRGQRISLIRVTAPEESKPQGRRCRGA